MNSVRIKLFLLICASGVISERTKNPFYVIAHMTNSKKALDYAMQENANAIETDLRFDEEGNPTLFVHGGFCECFCEWDSPMCSYGLDKSCEGPSASQLAKEHLEQAATYKNLALVIIDSKVDGMVISNLVAAGEKVIPFVDQHLFGNGYKGNVIISASTIVSYEYIKAATEAATRSPNFRKYKFTFDQEGDNFPRVTESLSRITKQRVFGTGIIVCLPISYHKGIKKAVAARDQNEVGMVYIWTLDNQNSMMSYISEGVDGVMTNSPGKLARLAKVLKLQLATQDDEIPEAKLTSGVTERTCDCEYRWSVGGCVISFPAPPGHACQCQYLGWKGILWTCTGQVIMCNDNSTVCQNPDESLLACKLGGGNCKGYA